MKSVNEQLTDIQKMALESLEPMQGMNSVAAQAFERIARKNYDLMGDLVEYAVAQVKIPSSEANMQELYEQRVADTQAFAEKVNERAAEYVALASELGEMVQTQAVSEVASQVASEATSTVTSQAPDVKKAAPAKKAAAAKSASTAEKATPAKKKTAARKTATKAK